jgi:hypothetical protein
MRAIGRPEPPPSVSTSDRPDRPESTLPTLPTRDWPQLTKSSVSTSGCMTPSPITPVPAGVRPESPYNQRSAPKALLRYSDNAMLHFGVIA